MTQPHKFTTLRRQANASRPKPALPGQDFGSVEAMLRADASQNPVPPGLTGRLRQSLASPPPQTSNWWQRLFRRKPRQG